MAHTITFVSSFKHPGFITWYSTSGSPAAETAIARWRGARGVRFNVSGTTGYLCANGRISTNGLWDASINRDMWVAFAFNVQTLPDSGHTYTLGSHYSYSPAGQEAAVRINSNGTLGLYNGVGGTWENGSYVISTNKWYVISVKNVRNTPPVYKLYSNAIGLNILETKTHSTNVIGGACAFYLGPYATSYGDVIYSDFMQEFTDGGAIDDPINVLGSAFYKVIGLTGIANGTYNGAGNYTDVDDWANSGADDGDTTTRSLPNSTKFSDTLTVIKDHITGCYGCLASAKMKTGTTGQDAANLIVVEGGASSLNNSPTLVDGVYYIYMLPWDGGWTEAQVKSLEVGVMETSGSYGSNVTTATMLEVAYAYVPLGQNKMILSM
jgi:hypothetical protein